MYMNVSNIFKQIFLSSWSNVKVFFSFIELSLCHVKTEFGEVYYMFSRN